MDQEKHTLTPEELNDELDLTLLMNKIFRYVWAVLGIGCLAGVIFAGAWWHLFTAGICLCMYWAFKAEEKQIDGNR